MKTLLAVTITSLLSVGYPTMTHAERQAENKAAAGAKSLMQRLKESILPGLHRPSSEPHSYLTPPSKPNHFRVPFKGGQSRLYANNVHSPCVVDTHSPEGNLFELRF